MGKRGTGHSGIVRRIPGLVGGWITLALVIAPAWAQDIEGTAPRTNGGLPRENVRALAQRSPSILTREAPVSSSDITQTEEERDERPRETRKFSVQILLSILDAIQQVILDFFGSATLLNSIGDDLSNVTDLTDTGGLTPTGDGG